MSRIISDVKLFFLGKRNYIKSALQLKLALKGILTEQGLRGLSDIFVRRYKQLQEADSPLEIVPASQVEPPNSLRATLAVTLGERPLDYKLIEVPGEIEQRPEIFYRQADYREHSDTEARIDLREGEDFWAVLDEAVQLAKVFHIRKYERNVRYKFVVGGFEQLRYMEATKGESLEISCRIMRHIFHESTIYNYTRITVKSDSNNYSFFMPFIGKELE